MGFIREPEGVDFIIAPSQSVKEDVVAISNYIQQHKIQVKTSEVQFLEDCSASDSTCSMPKEERQS